MNSKELLDNNPLAAAVIQRWFYAQMLQSLNTDQVTEEFKEYVKSQAINNESIGRIIDLNPRSLFDVLDDYDLHIDVQYVGGKFRATFSGYNSLNVFIKLTRREVEADIIKMAIEELNKKLEHAGQNSGTSDAEIPTEE